MIVCPGCQHRNPEDASECRQCGASLAGFAYRACPRCDALNPPDNAFCNRCLAPIRTTDDALAEPDASECVSSFQPGADSIPPQHPAPPPIRPVRDDSRSAFRTVGRREPDERQLDAREDATERPASRSEEVAARRLPHRLVRRDETPPREPATDQPVKAAFHGAPQRWDELDLLPIEAAIARAHRPTYVPPRGPTADEEEQAAALEQLLLGPPPLGERRRVHEAVREPLPMRAVRLLLSLLVLAAAVLAAIGPGGLTGAMVPREAALDLADSLNGLGPDDTVLLAFAYSPSYSGEMDPLADAVIETLARRQVAVVAVATDPAGVALARQRLGHVEEIQADYAYGTHYVVAGYLSGYRAGAQALCEGWGGLEADAVQRRPWADLGATADLAGAADVTRVILLADDGATARMWVEQLGACLQAPVDALVTGQLEAPLTPYLLSGQLAHLVAGGVAGGELEIALGTRGQAAAWADGYAALLVILVLAAVFANVFYISAGPEGAE